MAKRLSRFYYELEQWKEGSGFTYETVAFTWQKQKQKSGVHISKNLRIGRD
jgi:hypothetical protein